MTKVWKGTAAKCHKSDSSTLFKLLSKCFVATLQFILKCGFNTITSQILIMGRMHKLSQKTTVDLRSENSFQQGHAIKYKTCQIMHITVYNLVSFLPGSAFNQLVGNTSMYLFRISVLASLYLLLCLICNCTSHSIVLLQCSLWHPQHHICSQYLMFLQAGICKI